MKVKKNKFTIFEEFEGAKFEFCPLTPGALGRLIDLGAQGRGEELRIQQAMDGIVGWSEVYDDDDKPIPYSDKLKQKREALSAFLEHVEGFAVFVADSINKAAAAKQEAEEALTKNS